MHRPILTLAVLVLAVLAAGSGVRAADYRSECLEHVKLLIAEPRPEGSHRLGDCVRDDITTGQVDVQSMGFAVLSDAPGRNVQKLIDAGYPVATGQGLVVIGTLNQLFGEGKLTGEVYLDSIEPLIRAGAFVMLGNGELDVLSELLRNAPEPHTVCSFAEMVGGFDIFEDRQMPRDFAASNDAFGPEEQAVLAACGL